MGEDPCPTLPIERAHHGEGVGDWVPTKKHALLCDYISATRYARRKFPGSVFIDPFCGPGRIQVKGESFTREGGAVVAWRESDAGGVRFGNVFVGDIDEPRVNACHDRLTAIGASVAPFCGPAAKTIHKMVDQVPPRHLCLAYVDPYNLELLSFSIFQALARIPKVDIAVNFSTMDLKRNVELEFTRGRFDEVSPGWSDRVDVKATPKSQLALRFFDDWHEQVRGVGFSASKEMPLVMDGSRALYRLVFFSRDPLPERIWGDVARGPSGSPNMSFDF
jgi:three-Cys-motif partner protein